MAPRLSHNSGNKLTGQSLLQQRRSGKHLHPEVKQGCFSGGVRLAQLMTNSFEDGEQGPSKSL